MTSLSDMDWLTVTDLKNYVHCPRFSYYEHCLPAIRPTTYLMEAGKEEHERERERARRRTLRAYDLPEGERHFAVKVACPELGLRGELDELVVTPNGDYLPADYKLSMKVNESFILQVTAYALLIERQFGVTVQQAYIYLLLPRTFHAVPITSQGRSQVLAALDHIRTLARHEAMPDPPPQRAKCRACEFRRFCNDVV